MGLFSKRTKDPFVHPPVERTVHVRAAMPDVVAHLGEYSTLWAPKRSEEHAVGVAVSGDWVAIRLPDAVHPWQLHNLAFWMLDCAGGSEVIAVSGDGPTHPGYRLVRDPELDDALCGWDHEGAGWTVSVPLNAIARNEDVPVGRALTVPGGHVDWQQVVVRLEDPGADMNPTNDATASRRQLATAIDPVAASMTWVD